LLAGYAGREREREREGTNSVQGLNSSPIEGDGISGTSPLLTDANDEMKMQL
jgi:hypothetical protein